MHSHFLFLAYHFKLLESLSFLYEISKGRLLTCRSAHVCLPFQFSTKFLMSDLDFYRKLHHNLRCNQKPLLTL